ncbi:hypothetical protein ABFS83_12G038200 [Erythranthe nasuta]
MDLLENPELCHTLRRLNSKIFKKFYTFMWNGSHVSAVVRYLQRSRSSGDISIKLLESLEASRNTSRFPGMVLSFTENLGGFFRVPEVVDLSADCSNYRPNELLASFLDFLLDTVEEIVKCHSDLTDPLEDEMGIMQEQLTFLAAILGDTPFTCTNNNVLKQVMDVANDAARFLHLYFFTNESHLSRVDLSLAELLKMFQHVEAKIKEHCSLGVPLLPSSTAPTADVDSLFVVNSLVNDLKELLMSRDGGPIADACNGIVTTLLEELMLVSSLLEFFKEEQPPPHVEPVLWIIDSAYEAEYLINTFVVGDIPVWYLTLRLPHVIQKIKLIGIGLEEIKENCNNVKYLIDSFRVGDVPVWYLKPRLSNVIDNIKVVGPEEIKINASVDDGIVVGIEDEATIIVDQLTGGEKQLVVISIFGMPGIGKTTLARKLYDGPAALNRFDRRAWIVVSEKYQRRRLLVDILQSICDLDRDRMSSMDAESLGVEIHKTLKGRRYLIVMDDVWASAVLDDVGRYLPDDGNESRILITSRLKDVAPPGSTVRTLPFLSHEQCWDLLKRKLFRGGDPPPQDLIDVGKKIAALCQGLPLAVVVIAAVLANMGNRKGLWDEVAGNLSFKISTDSSMCMKILELSYEHLPAHLKPCFLYFGAFPEDSEIPVGKLTSLWIAEGFVLEQGQKSARDVAEGYLTDLVDRSLVLIAKSRSGGGVRACSIHDLLRELCLRKAKQENFMNVITDRFSVYERNHRVCIPPESIDVESRPFGLHIRSWLGHWPGISFIYSRMKLLRVLDLSAKNDPINVSGIEQLVHLRYLAVRVTEDHIPPSIGRLENLEFLLLYGPGSVEITEDFLNLVKLRHLHIAEHATFGESCHRRAALAEKSFRMDSLESISGLWIIHEDDEKVLRCFFPRVRRLKCATKPLWDSSEKCHRYVALDDCLTMLESLNISYLGSEYLKLPDTLNLPSSLKKLTLHDFKLSRNEMSMIGRLPKLEALKLLYAVFDGKEWKTNDDEFRELKFLKLDALKIRRWNTCDDHFPRLQRLVMHKCWKLKKFPRSLGDIPTLQVVDIHSCSKSVANSALDVQREQLEYGNDELKIIISGSLW